MLEIYAPNVIHDFLEHEPPLLTLFINGDVREILDKEVELSLFDDSVRIMVMNLKEAIPVELLKGIDRTRTLLEKMRMEL